ncbi:MAG: nucleoside 2-deoxyribosyltransferase [Oscillospiraceae bacterium]|nr:nucleoside 2-deoxyribosyltransferase [Oscillospiraceae bacterium]
MSAPKLYICSPQRLAKDGAAWYADAAALAERYGFSLLMPPAAAFCPKSTREEGKALAAARLALMQQCDLLMADTRDFRNELEPHAEAGFALGFAHGLGKKLYCYMPDARTCTERYGKAVASTTEEGVWLHQDGMSLEPGALNLMLTGPALVVEGGLEDALKRAAQDFFGEEK